jgi:RHS repeat-associated protein
LDFPYNLRFPGQYYQPETGLNQNWNRDYDPIVGRYIESDPIGLKGGSYSTYAYVSDDPVRWSDPLALCKVMLEFAHLVLNYYHISIYTSDSSGNMWFAGGPAHDAIRGGGSAPQEQDYGPDPWGRVVGAYGPMIQSLPKNTRIVVDDGKPCSCYNKSFEDSIDRINSMNIPYDPFLQNSNSLAGTILSNAGLTVPSNWPYGTPGYSNNLNNYVPSFLPIH